MQTQSIGKSPTATVIVPYKQITDVLYKCVKSLLNQTIKDIEIILLPDVYEKLTLEDHRISIIAKPGSPSEKRNLGVELAKSGNIAFIDDDAYAPENWIEVGVRNLSQESIVGGPNIMAPENNARRKASDLFYTYKLGTLREVYRYKPVGTKRYVDNLGTVNLFILKQVFVDTGGFDGKFWPGEDTHLYEKLKKNGYKVFYDPSLFVYHRRREVFYSHIKQLWEYAKYRGRALKRGEVKLFYLIPSLLLIVTASSAIAMIMYDELFFVLFLLGFVAVSIITFTTFLKKSLSIKVTLLGVATFWLSHLAYSVGVFRGLISWN